MTETNVNTNYKQFKYYIMTNDQAIQLNIVSKALHIGGLNVEPDVLHIINTVSAHAIEKGDEISLKSVNTVIDAAKQEINEYNSKLAAEEKAAKKK